jgi:hypothetical protein
MNYRLLGEQIKGRLGLPADVTTEKTTIGVVVHVTLKLGYNLSISELALKTARKLDEDIVGQIATNIDEVLKSHMLRQLPDHYQSGGRVVIQLSELAELRWKAR